MGPERARLDEAEGRPVTVSSNPAARAIKRGFELVRYMAAIGSVTALLLSFVTFLWALTKAWSFVNMLLAGSASADMALVQLFQSVDSILIATVMLIVGFGLWELFVGELDLPPSLNTLSFDHLKGRTASTLLLVLVVRFLEVLVTRPEPDELLAVGITVSLVGLLLFVFSAWHRTH